MVSKTDFPFEFSMPEFGVEESTPDGTILYLSELMVSDDKTVVLKNFSKDDIVRLIASDPVVESGFVDNAMAVDNSLDIQGFHFYQFGDEIKVFSEYALSIQILT